MATFRDPITGTPQTTTSNYIAPSSASVTINRSSLQMPDLQSGVSEIRALRNRLEGESKAAMGQLEETVVGQIEKVKTETAVFTDPETFVAPIRKAYQENATRLANMSTANSRLALEELAAMEADSPDARQGVRFRQRIQSQRQIVEAQANGLAQLDLAVADSVVRGISIAAENKSALNSVVIQAYNQYAATAADFFGKYSQIQASLVIGESDAIAQAAKITADLIISKEQIAASRASTAAQLDVSRLEASVAQARNQTELQIAQIQARSANPIVPSAVTASGRVIGRAFDPLTGRSTGPAYSTTSSNI
jgi:hypothetical protein